MSQIQFYKKRKSEKSLGREGLELNQSKLTFKKISKIYKEKARTEHVEHLQQSLTHLMKYFAVSDMQILLEQKPGNCWSL